MSWWIISVLKGEEEEEDKVCKAFTLLKLLICFISTFLHQWKDLLTYDFHVLLDHWGRIGTEENVKVKDSTDGAPGEGRGGLEDHIWWHRATSDETFDLYKQILLLMTTQPLSDPFMKHLELIMTDSAVTLLWHCRRSWWWTVMWDFCFEEIA